MTLKGALKATSILNEDFRYASRDTDKRKDKDRDKKMNKPCLVRVDRGIEKVENTSSLLDALILTITKSTYLNMER
jgi:hypothetical protein